ncbi:autotransporter outer membrane beta-barrel domain-containing protein [Plastoroseomonas hellenica]|uniref:autotransporter outer membrane beta-barrel domain-containing protein n=1 Tax=Plastoroseomonas hellenica TaxID=2687306 RepID=UPI001BA68601|nr:autotransporter outer membrane beta-barrel domain-containing protein [Plastoroseomonas hellenica]MBR0647286.1 autotransporter outer membrane beta-barrel domain-containing protein [Plastoroseomonas hellenica]
MRTSQKARLLAGASWAALAIACWLPPPASAADYQVDSETALRQAIIDANGDLDPASTITLTGNVVVTDPTALGAATKPLTIATGAFTLSGLTATTITGTGGNGATFIGGPVVIQGIVTGGAAAVIDGAGTGGIGVTQSSGSLTNNGQVTGGQGGNTTFVSPAGRISGAGGAGLSATGSTIVNEATRFITGGAGGILDVQSLPTGGLRGDTGAGGAGAIISGGSLDNRGTIQGGAGGNILNAAGADEMYTGAGGAGLSASGSTILNAAGGVIAGGAGGDRDIQGVPSGGSNGQTGAGGAGAIINGGSLNNEGIIRGGAGGNFLNAAGADNMAAGAGGAGALIIGGTHLNTGTIAGGLGGLGANAGASGHGAGGTGLSLTDGLLVNAGSITAGNGQAGGGTTPNPGSAGGVGVILTNSAIENRGAITGGNGGGGALAGAAVTGTGSRVINTGIITAGVNDLGVSANAITFSGGGNVLELRALSAITGNVVAGAGDTLALGGTDNASFAVGQIGPAVQYRGFGAFEKTGTSTWTLTGTTTTVTPWTITQGTLALTADAALGPVAGALTFNGGTLRFDAGFDLAAARAVSIAAGGGTIDTNGFTTTIAQVITGTGALQVTGPGILILTGANTYAGGTILTQGTLAVAADGALGAATGALTFNGGTLRFDAGFDLSATRAIGITAAGGTIDTNGITTTIAQGITGLGALTVAGPGGSLILTGENTYTGGTTINAGVLVQLGTGGTSGSIVGNVLNNGTLTFNRSDALVLAGAISGSGAVRQEGTGTTVLTGENTYTGGTTITQGTLQLGNGGTSGSIIGNVVNNSLHSLVFNRSDTLVFPGVISGIGAVRQEGTGTTVLTGANTYSGPTSVNAGTLQAGAAGSFSPASAVTVASAGTLALAGFDQTVAGLTNAGLVTLGGAPGTRLTVAGNYVGQGGILALNTFLGGDSSASDRLVISGGTATGDTRVRITNVGGPGAQTVEGIRVVETQAGGTTAAGAFRLDTRVAAGAFEYQLFRGGSASAQDWYLRSFMIPETPGTPEEPGTPDQPGPAIPLYRPEVALYAPIAAIGRQMGLATLGTLHERVGELDNIRDLTGSPPYANGAWARAFGERTRNRWDGTVDSRATGNLIGLQAGFDILRTRPYAGGHRDHAGVYVAYTDYNAPNVSGFALGQHQRVGRLLMSGPSVGAYWTHFGPSGWYVDAVFQANWFDVKASSDFGTTMNTNGVGYTASLEAGYPIRFGGGWQVEPQAQIIWQSVSVDRSRDLFSSVDWNEDDAVTGRLGARLQYTGRDARTLWQPYAKVNLWHAFSGSDRVTLGNSAPIENRFGETALEVGAGITARVNQTTSFYAHADYRWSFGGDSRQTAVQGAIGIRFNW